MSIDDEEEGKNIKCPNCGKVDDIDGFDVIGADANNVFCTDCHCEFNPWTGKVREGKVTDGQ